MFQWNARYDTDGIPAPDRYAYYRDGARAELAPVAAQGRAPGRLRAAMSVARVGDLHLEAITWEADSPIVARRTARLIRSCDPDCYRLLLHAKGGEWMEQAGNVVFARPGDIALYDLSMPWRADHATGREMRVVMLTIPKALLPFKPAQIRPLVGLAVPRDLRGRSELAQLLVELTSADTADPDLADVLTECAVGLLRQRLGLPDGMTPRTRRAMQVALIRAVMRRLLGNSSLDPGVIADAARMSPRYLHKICQDCGFKPMETIKRMRLELCLRALKDPMQAGETIKDIAIRYGYGRPDQFARDFRQQFGVSARRVRGVAG